jgi:hypothetical protein
VKKHLHIVGQVVATPEASEPWAAVVIWQEDGEEISRASAASEDDAAKMVKFCMRAVVTYAHRDDDA